MPLHQQGDRAPSLGGELEPAGGRHGGATRLADHRAQCAVAQPFLHQRQNLGIVGSLGIEHAFGREARLVQAGREQVAAAHDPQYRSPGTSGDPGEEQGGGGIVAHGRRGGGDLVQGIEPQAIVAQARIDRAEAERQHRATAVAIAFDGAERVAQGLEDARLGHGRYDSLNGVSFLLCSKQRSRVIPLKPMFSSRDAASPARRRQRGFRSA